jgi:hypothetical protein
MGNQQEMDIAWLAGIFDGEGTITMTKNNGTKHPEWNARKSEMSIANCDERLIVKCVSILESNGIRPYITTISPRKNLNQFAYRMCVSKLADTKKLAEMLLPHLTSKREQATMMIRYATSRLDRAFILNESMPDGKKHMLTRRPISKDEQESADLLIEYNNRNSRSSTTAREGAKLMLERRKIQSGLMRKYKKSAEMTGSAA